MSLSKEQWNTSFENGKDYTPLNIFLLSELLEYLEVTEGEVTRMLDLGCGTGDAVVKFAEHGIAVTGVDFSTAALDKAREHVSEAGLEESIDFQEADLEEFDPATLPEDYDLIFSKLVFTFLEDKEGFLQRIKKSLDQTDGYFVLITPVLFEGVEYDSFLGNISVPYERTRQQLEEIFNTVEAFHINYFKEKGVKVTFLLS